MFPQQQPLVPVETNEVGFDPVVEYRIEQFLLVGLSLEIASVLALRSNFQTDVADARRLKKLGATPAEILRIIW